MTYTIVKNISVSVFILTACVVTSTSTQASLDNSDCAAAACVDTFQPPAGSNELGLSSTGDDIPSVYIRTDVVGFAWIRKDKQNHIWYTEIPAECAAKLPGPRLSGNGEQLQEFATISMEFPSQCRKYINWANSVDNPEDGFVFSRTDSDEIRWVATDAEGRWGHTRITAQCAAEMASTRVYGTWDELNDLAPHVDSIDSPCQKSEQNDPSFTEPPIKIRRYGYLFNVTESVNTYWITRKTNSIWGRVLITSQCATRIGKIKMTGTMDMLNQIAPQTDYVDNPCDDFSDNAAIADPKMDDRFIFYRTDTDEIRLIGKDMTDRLGHVWISKECADILNLPSMSGDWEKLNEISSGQDTIPNPCGVSSAGSIKIVLPIYSDHQINETISQKWNRLKFQYETLVETGNLEGIELQAMTNLEFAKENFPSSHHYNLTSLNDIADVYLLTGRLMEAEELLNTVIEIQRTQFGYDHPDTLNARFSLAEVMYEKGNIRSSTSDLEEILSLRRKKLPAGHKKVIDSLIAIGIVQLEAGLYGLAEKHIREGLDLLQKNETSSKKQVFRAKQALADLFASMYKYEEAEELFQKLLKEKTIEYGDYHHEVLITLNALALLYNNMGDSAKAERIFTDAIAVLEIDDSREKGTLLSLKQNLANVFESQGRYGEAEKNMISVVDSYLNDSESRPMDIASSHNQLGVIYLKQNRPEPARRQFQKGLDAVGFSIPLAHPIRNTMRANLAITYDDDSQEATELLRRNLDHSVNIYGRDSLGAASSINDLAINLYSRGEFSEARDLLAEVTDTLDSKLGDNHPRYLNSLPNLAAVYESTGDIIKARQLLQKADRKLTELYGYSNPDVISIKSTLVLFYIQQQEWKNAEEHIEALVNGVALFQARELWMAGESTRATYRQQSRAINDLILTLYDSHPSEKTARLALQNSLNNKALLLEVASIIAAITGADLDPALKALVENARALRRQVSLLANSGSRHSEERIAAADELNALQAQLANEIPEFSRTKNDATVDQIRSTLGVKDLLVDYQVYRYIDSSSEYVEKLMVTLLSHAEEKKGVSNIKMISLGELDGISNAVNNYRTRIANGKSVDVVASTLYKKLWEPLGVDSESTDRIYIASDDLLNLIPIGSLIDKDGSYLAEKLNLLMIASGRDLIDNRNYNPENIAAIFAAPEFGEYPEKLKPYSVEVARHSGLKNLKFKDLPFALVEGDELKKQFDEKEIEHAYYSTKNATENNIRKIESPRILHLATHGFFLKHTTRYKHSRGLQPISSGRPDNASVFEGRNTHSDDFLSRSGLALANANVAAAINPFTTDGILTAQEILDLSLEGTELVVLSACDTGIGEVTSGEGLYDLKRAFQIAGARSVISTLWPISDRGTSEFMKSFYKKYLSGLGANDSLLATKREFIKSTKWSSPYYWAPFVLTGKVGS